MTRPDRVIADIDAALLAERNGVKPIPPYTLHRLQGGFYAAERLQHDGGWELRRTIERRRLNRRVAMFACALSVCIVAYFAWQFFGRSF